jgi:hypothetical protein
MATELIKPGASIIQQFRTVSPTIVSPTLVPCVVGPSYQVVESLETDSTGNSVVNTDAIVSVPPIIVASNAESYSGLDGLTLKVAVNNGLTQEVTFSDPTSVGLTADQAKSQILQTSGISGWTATTVTRGSNTYLVLKGTISGDGQELQILNGTANTILGFCSYFTAFGFSSYVQDKLFISQNNFPDPRSNIDELDFDEDSIRAFFNLGSSLQEAVRDEAFLRNGFHAWIISASDITFPTSGYKDNTLKLTLEKSGTEQVITFDGDFYANDGTLVVPGSVYADPGTDSISIQKNADSAVSVTFASPADLDAAITAINAAWAVVYSGEDICYRALSDGTADGAGTYIAFQVGGATATGDIVKVIEGTSGDAFSDIGFVSGSGSMSSSLIWTINNALNASTDEPNAGASGDKLKLWSYKGYIKIGTGTTNADLKLTDNDEQYALEGVDDGDGDTTSAVIRIMNADFTLDPGSATLTGTGDLSSEVYLHRKAFQVALDGGPIQEVEFNGGPITPTNPYADPGTDTLGLIINSTPVVVTFASPADIDAAITAINTAAGQTICYRSDNVGAASPTGTYISFQVGGATDAGGEIVIDYSASTGNAWTDIGFTGTVDIQQTNSSAEIESLLDGILGSGFASIVSNKLKLTSTKYGVDSKIEIGVGTANSTLGFTDNKTVYGLDYKPKAGDYLYADGSFLGIVVQVTPGAVKTDLRLDRQLSYTNVLKKDWYITAKNIPSTLPADRPTPNLVVDLAGDITIKHDILRDSRGEPVQTAADPLLIAYKALRLDVTASADDPALLVFEDTDELEDTLTPLTTDNPLGLGLFFALLNAPGITVSGLGINAVSADAPYGTLAAYNSALTFLEKEEVYALAPLTHDSTVHQAFQTHVNSMSDPDARGERIVLINPDLPDRNLDTLVASGTNGDTTGTVNEFDTKISNLAALLLAAGVDPTGTITVDDAVFLDIASDSKIYSISALNGTKITIRVAFAPGENDDDFYSTANLTSPLISESFSIKIRGSELVTSSGDPDYQNIAETYSELATSYGDRRVIVVAPDKAGASIDGLEQIIEGFYVCAGIAGMIGQQPPQQGFTNFPITGYTRVIGSNDVFSNRQMNIGAGGGLYWVIQEVANGPLTSRHQLTSDVTSIETRELSITKVVDYCAKFIRAGLRNFIGKFNITQGFLDTLSTVVQGQLSFLAENGIIIGGDLNNIVQDTDNPDAVLIDVTLDVPYPCNYIRLVLLI